MEAIECSKCGSKNIYTTSTERICRRCGHREYVPGFIQGNHPGDKLEAKSPGSSHSKTGGRRNENKRIKKEI